MRTGGRDMLVSSSENRGAIVLDFDFPHVTGLSGAAVIAAANNSDPLLFDRVWAASTVDRAFVSLRSRTCPSLLNLSCQTLANPTT